MGAGFCGGALVEAVVVVVGEGGVVVVESWWGWVVVWVGSVMGEGWELGLVAAAVVVVEGLKWRRVVEV